MKYATVLFWIVTGLASALMVMSSIPDVLRDPEEWAYAGLVFDLSGALYSHLSVGDPSSVWVFPIIGLFLVGGSYLLHRDKRWPVELRLDGRRAGPLNANEI